MPFLNEANLEVRAGVKRETRTAPTWPIRLIHADRRRLEDGQKTVRRRWSASNLSGNLNAALRARCIELTMRIFL